MYSTCIQVCVHVYMYMYMYMYTLGLCYHHLYGNYGNYDQNSTKLDHYNYVI